MNSPRLLLGLCVISIGVIGMGLTFLTLEAHREFSLPSPVGGVSQRRTPGPPVAHIRVSPSSHAEGEAVVLWIMDDIGMDPRVAYRVLQWPTFVSIAILPYAPWAPAIARKACAQRRDVLIHLPMTSIHPESNPGPYAITVGMAFPQIFSIVAHAKARIPCAIGLNQHMGSRASQSLATMEAVVRSAKRVGIQFFIDSLTIRRSRLCEAARRYGMPCFRRTLFFDAEASPTDLPHRWRRLAEIVRRASEPIVVIAHPYPATLDFLERVLRTPKSLPWTGRRPSELIAATLRGSLPTVHQ